MPSSYDTIYILGGHKLAWSYFEKLLDARRTGALSFKEAYLVDPDPDCFGSRVKGSGSRVIVKKYDEFILDYVARPGDGTQNDILVPDHTARHVMLQVFMGLVEREFPSYRVALAPLKLPFATPFLSKSENDAIWAVSYATWICPPDCAEPAICPHIADTRAWDFDRSLAELFDEILAKASNSAVSVSRFPTRPLFAEIVQIPFSHIRQVISDFLKALKAGPPLKVIVATHSHCHGILGQFEIKGSAEPF